ncbi:MAG: dihydropteroate synthase [Actinomycetes bacterium]
MTLVMGVVNVTPDSFSDGGRFIAADAAIAHGLELAAQGADIVDVGGESTRPGAERVPEDVELERVVPVVRALASDGIVVSVDTMRASVAAAAVEAGATIVNDVSGGLADPAMARTVAGLGVDYVAMHWRGHSTEMDTRDVYADVVAEVRDELAARVAGLSDAGVDPARIILDPGLGFAKVADSNWPLLARMDAWAAGHRVLIGASRKRFLGAVIARPGVPADDPSVREDATTAVTVLAAEHGAWAVRVHNATAAKDAIAVVNAWTNARNARR